MPKHKTHKGLSKRVKVTASGKIKARKCGAGHLMSVKTAKRRRGLKKSLLFKGVVVKTLKKMLGSSK